MPLFKCSASKAKPKNGIAYVTDEKKAKIVTVEIFLKTRIMQSSLKKRQAVLVKGISLTNGNTIIVNYRVRAKITFRLKRHTLTLKN